MSKIVTDELIFAVDPASKRSYDNGTLDDLAFGKLAGTLTNGPVFDDSHGGVITLDGTNDYIDFGNDAVTPALPFSLQCWVNFPTLGENDPIFSSSHHSSNYYGFWVQKNPTSVLSMSIGDGGSAGPSNRRTGWGPTITNNVWYNIVWIFRGATDMSIYVDGVAQSVSYDGTGGALNYSSGKPTRIGLFRSNYAEAKIAQLLVYSKGLTLDEVLQNYQATRGRFV